MHPPTRLSNPGSPPILFLLDERSGQLYKLNNNVWFRTFVSCNLVSFQNELRPFWIVVLTYNVEDKTTCCIWSVGGCHVCLCKVIFANWSTYEFIRKAIKKDVPTWIHEYRLFLFFPLMVSSLFLSRASPKICSAWEPPPTPNTHPL